MTENPPTPTSTRHGSASHVAMAILGFVVGTLASFLLLDRGPGVEWYHFAIGALVAGIFYVLARRRPSAQAAGDR